MEFFVTLDCFLPFYPPPPKNPENQNFEKWKLMPGDIIILHMCTINDNHIEKWKLIPGDIITLHMCTINDNQMMYGS